jgi:type I pantothenate kinase
VHHGPTAWVEYDREAFADRFGPRLAADVVANGYEGVLTREELAEVYAPLASWVAERASAARRPCVLSLVGSVAVGKSASARGLAHCLEAVEARAVSVVSTDGFLFPNAELGRRGLFAQKGFPQSFDVDALRSFVSAVRAGEPEVRAPRYSHVTYDVVADDPQVVHEPEVLVLEGLPILDDLAAVVDLVVYVDAPEPTIFGWYLDRFRELLRVAAEDPDAYLASLRGMPDDDALAMAKSVWDQINAVNLHRYILPVRDEAHVVLEKGDDHAVRRIRVRTG